MEGLWTAEFGSNLGIFGGGVIVLSNNIAMGGDGAYYYTGDYSIQGDTLRATLRVIPFVEGQQSVFGTTGQELTLNLVGNIRGDLIMAQGHPESMPNLRFAVKLTKRL